LRLFRAGFPVLVAELPQPLAVRRTVSFAEAVYEGLWTVERVTARRVEKRGEIRRTLEGEEVAVLVDPELDVLRASSGPRLPVRAVVDARLTKLPPAPSSLPAQGRRGGKTDQAPVFIGLGPAFSAGVDCDAVVETMRGHTLGRVYWHGGAMADTNQPEGDPRRVLRAPVRGAIHAQAEIGQRVEAGQILAEVRASGTVRYVTSPFAGVLRGMIRSGLEVSAGLKVGDVDPRNDPSLCYLVSDKSLAVGGGVLEALLTWSRSSDHAKGSGEPVDH
jgi:xanthine dehydrogenase accessory factor